MQTGTSVKGRARVISMEAGHFMYTFLSKGWVPVGLSCLGFNMTSDKCCLSDFSIMLLILWKPYTCVQCTLIMSVQPHLSLPSLRTPILSSFQLPGLFLIVINTLLLPMRLTVWLSHATWPWATRYWPWPQRRVTSAAANSQKLLI